jgi:hypothetical protein
MSWGFIVLCIGFSSHLMAQNCKTVNLFGSIRDTTSRTGFYNVFIVNQSAGRGVFGKPDGSFSLDVNPGDSIFFRISGYQTLKVKAVADSSCRHEFRAFIKPLEYKKEEVVVYPVKSLSQIKEERERLAKVETRMVTGLDALKSPITALYQEFSRRERMKKKLAQLQFQDNMEQVVKELLRVYVSYDIIELSEEEFMEFMQFMNLNEAFLKTASDYELIIYIKEKYIHFRQIRADGNYIYNPQKTELIQPKSKNRSKK